MPLSTHRSSPSSVHADTGGPNADRFHHLRRDDSDIARPSTDVENPTGGLDPRFIEYRATRDRAIRNALIEDHRWVAQYCARSFRRRAVPAEDLHQVAMVGPVNAVDRFDPSFGYSFTTFAVPTITGELRRHIRDCTWAVRVRRRAQENYVLVSAAGDELQQTLGRWPTVRELGDRTGLDPDEILEALDLAENLSCASLNASSDHEDEGDRDDQMCLAVDETGYASCETRVITSGLLAVLPTDRDRLIIRMRFVDGLSQSQIAAELGLSQVHISRLLRASLDLMRKHLVASSGHLSGEGVTFGELLGGCHGDEEDLPGVGFAVAGR